MIIRTTEEITKPAALSLREQPYVEAGDGVTDAAGSRRLDLSVPAGEGPFPLIIWIHGGGWHSGERQPHGDQLAARFCPAGFAVAAVGYRLTPEAAFPAQIEDCNAALAWLRRYAADYRLDANRVGVIGHSAGGHLCALMAVTGGLERFAGGEVQAAVCWSPVCDLDRERGEWPKSMFTWNPVDRFSQTFFPGGGYDAAFARGASPASYVHGKAPPMLIVHGDRDDVVPIGQARAFADALRASGAEVDYRVAEGRDHSVMDADAETEALRFFKKVL